MRGSGSWGESPPRKQPGSSSVPWAVGFVSAGLAHGAFHLAGDVRFGSGSRILVAVLAPVPKLSQSNAQRDEGGENPLQVHSRDHASARKGALILTLPHL